MKKCASSCLAPLVSIERMTSPRQLAFHDERATKQDQQASVRQNHPKLCRMSRKTRTVVFNLRSR